MLEWGFGKKRHTLEASAREAAFKRLRAFSEKLVGREDTLGELVRTACSQRLVTLHGVAGVGKTALLHIAAARLAEAGAFPAGVYWVSLRGILHSGAAKEAILRILPKGSDPCLVILDGADGIAVVPLVQDLLTRFPSLHVTITIRCPLGLSGESTIALKPLPTSDIRRLLVSWAHQELDPNETAALARLLDGNPQATRFTATLLSMEPLTALRTQLERELTTRALQGQEEDLLLAVSRDLLLERLPTPARNLLGALSLFSSGAYAEDLEVVWGKDWQELVGILQRSGLVLIDEGRYQVAVDLAETPPQAVLGPTGVLLALALGHLRAGSFEIAFDIGERALTKARLSQNSAGFARALLVLGMVTLQEDPARAVLLFEEAATHAKSLGEALLFSEARRWEGAALGAIKEPEAALAALYEAHQGGTNPRLEAFFTEVQGLLTGHGGGSLLAALSVDAATIREGGLLAARVRLGLPGK